MKIPSLSKLIRHALQRSLTRLGRYLVSHTLESAMRPARASARHRPHATRHIIDGECRRIDSRHNNSW